MNSSVNKILIVLISLSILSIFLLPFGYVYNVEDKEEHWEKLYLLEDWFSLIFFLPFVILWGIYLLYPKILKSGLLKFVFIVTGLLAFWVSFSTCTMLAQDYEPSWGALLSLLTFPLFVAFLINRRTLMKTK